MNTKSSVFYPVAIAASFVALVGVLLVWQQFSITIEPIEAETSVLPQTKTVEVLKSDSSLTSAISTVPKPTSKSIELVKQKTSSVSTPQLTANAAASPGALRIINQTDHPLRVALLAQQTANASTSTGSTYVQEPVHWDFAPGEGSSQGLLLSLPAGELKLKKGDILVAFAQDGSRLYWGPYVVGQTNAPIWNRQNSEWQMILK